MAAGLAVGATTSAASGSAFTATWYAVAGLGLGLAMPAAMNAALGALTAERSGSGSALITAMRQVGATIGVAVLGTVLLSAYRSQLDLGGLPAAAAAAVRTGVGAGVAVAAALHSAALLGEVRAAFAHGLDVMLAVCAGIAGLSALLALAFLPRQPGAAGQPRTGPSRPRPPGPGQTRPPRPALRSRSRTRTGRIRGMSTHDDDQPGLRERKKARTRASIREHALRLFREQGYAATRVEQIAEAAEVSPATFYRYFPTKEDVVLQDDLDLLTLEALEAQPAGLSPLAAVRAAVAAARAGFTPEERERFRQTTELTMAVPEIRARAMDEFARTIDVTAAVLARRSGRKPDDVAVRALSGAIFGVILASTLPILERGQLDLDGSSPWWTPAWPSSEAGFTPLTGGPARRRQRTSCGRNCTLIRGPVARAVFGTACSQVRWQLPPITSRSPWPMSWRSARPPPRGRSSRERGAPRDRMATTVSSVAPRPIRSPCQATLSRPSRYRQRPAVQSGSPRSGR